MDFFGILYDMKNGKKVPYSKTYFDTLFAAKLAEMQIKTLTGTLPLTFRTSETALRSWTIYGNNYEHKYSTSGTLPLTFSTHTAGAASDWVIEGNNNIGKNLLDIADSTVISHVDIQSVDGATGSITITADVGYTYRGSSKIITDLLEIGKSYIITIYNNTDIPLTQRANVGLRRVDTNSFIESVGADNFAAQGIKTMNYTHTAEYASTGVYFSILVNGNNTNGGTVSVSNAMIRLADTSADFEPYQVGVGQRTKNLLEITASTGRVNNVNFSVDKDKGTISATSEGATNATTTISWQKTIPAGSYKFSAQLQGSDSTYRMDVSMQDWTFLAVNYSGDSSISLNEATTLRFRVVIFSGYTANNVVFKPMLRAADADVNFIPFGYEIPLTVNNTPQTFYIGDTPLTAGQSISKTSTGVDIAAIAGTNTITTELYNKPEMSIEGVDYVGVGEYVNGQWQIPLTVTCDRNLFKIYGNMAHSGGVHTIDFNVETSSVTGEMPADSFYQLGFQNVIVKGDETFVISFDKTTAGTAELRMMNGTGSSAEIIETFDISAAKSYRVVFECEESFGDVYPWLVATEAATNTFEHIMIKKASDKGGFVPYGAHTDYTIPIDAPLTEGQSVSDTVEITAYEGTNTIDTTMANKPNMSITYKGG